MLKCLICNRVKQYFLIITVPMFLLLSCTSTNHLVISSKDSKLNVDIFLKDTKEPPKDFEIVAYVESTGSIFTTQTQLINALKKRANKLGGDAIIQVEIFYIPWVLSSLPSAKGVVVKYK